MYWDYDDGFSPSSVLISPGESVVWWNSDVYGFSVTITVVGSLVFTLDQFEGLGYTFLHAGTYSVHSNWGDNGSVTVKPPSTIALRNPRTAGTQFLFDVAGLTVGTTNVVQYCTNLVAGAWTSTATNVATGTSATITNAPSVGPRYYRVFERP